MFSDSNPMVMANAVAAMTEINEASSIGKPLILDNLSNFNPTDDREAQSMFERITPRLAHANAAVVLSAVEDGQGH